MSSTNAEAATYADLELACLCNLSLAWIKLGSMAKAEEACCRALLRWPSNAKALFRRGQARLALGRPVEAATDFRKVSVQEPANTEATKMLHRALEGVRPTTSPRVDLEAQQRRGVHDGGGLTFPPFLAETSGGGEASTKDKKKHLKNNTTMVHEATTDLTASSGCEDSERLLTTYSPHHAESGPPASSRVLNTPEEADNHSRPEDGISTDTHGVSSFMVSDWLNSAAREEAEQKVTDKYEALFTSDPQQEVPSSKESCEDNAVIDARGGGDASVSRLVSQLKARKASKQQKKQKSPRATRKPNKKPESSRLKAEELRNMQVYRQRCEGPQAGMPAKVDSRRVIHLPENARATKGDEPSSGEAARGNRMALQASEWALLVEEEKQVRDAFRAKLCAGIKKNTKNRKKAVSRTRAEVPP